MADRTGDDGVNDGSLLGGESEYETVDERYREPEEPEFGLGPDIPRAPDPTGNDVDPQLSARFWALAFVFNVAVLGVGVGALIALLGGNARLGGQLFLGGLVVFGYGVYRYRQVRQGLDDGRNADSDGTSDGDRNPAGDGTAGGDRNG